MVSPPLKVSFLLARLVSGCGQVDDTTSEMPVRMLYSEPRQSPNAQQSFDSTINLLHQVVSVILIDCADYSDDMLETDSNIMISSTKDKLFRSLWSMQLCDIMLSELASTHCF